MTPHLQHPTRAFPRPLRPGDRIRRRPATEPQRSANYPGANLFGTVTWVGPSGVLANVALDNGVRINLFTRWLTRL